MRYLAIALLLAIAVAAQDERPGPVENLREYTVAGEVDLTWTMPTNNIDGTPLTDLAGAKVYYGTESSNYTTVIDVGYVEAYTITGLVAGVRYHCNGTAYNAAGLESDFCDEVGKVAK